MASLILLPALLAAVLGALFVYTIFREYRYDYRALRQKCGIPVRKMSHPFGIYRIYMALKNMRDNTNLEKAAEAFLACNTFRTQLGGMLFTVTIEPENVKAVLKTNFQDYSMGLRYDAFFPLLGNGIFTLSGDGWKHSRAMLRPQFSRQQISQLDSMRCHVNLLFQHFDQPDFVECQQLFHELTLDTATEFLFGASSDCLGTGARTYLQGPRGPVSGQEFADSFTRALFELASRLNLGSLYFLRNGRQFQQDIAVCHNFVDYFVYRALEKPLNHGEEKEKDNKSFVFIEELTRETRDPVVIRDQSFNILLAGRDTTASLLTFIVYYMGIHDDIYQKLREAVFVDLGREDSDAMTFENLKSCQYLQAVVNEALRLHPIVPHNFRTAIRDTQLPVGGGKDGTEPILIEKGSSVMYSTFAIHRNPKHWGEDATKFVPERWINEKIAPHQYDYLPFNGGPRVCLGQQFALTEVCYTLARICQAYSRIEIAANQKHQLEHRLTMHFAVGLDARFYK